MLSNPVKFSHPDFRRLLLQQHKKREVLRKGIRKLNIAVGRRVDGRSLIADRVAIRIWDPEWKDRVAPLGLWFEWKIGRASCRERVLAIV